MSTFFQIAASVASIASIPLAIYLYLRGREARYQRVRQEIARTLTYQIGEGRELSVFEVQAVIESKLREYKIARDAVVADQVVEDLVTETISNPMLDSSRKEKIIGNLRKIHNTGAAWSLVRRYDISLFGLLSLARQEGKPLDEEDEFVLRTLERMEPVVEVPRSRRPSRLDFVANLFGLLALVSSVLTVLFVWEPMRKIWPPIFAEHRYAFLVSLGVLASLIAAVVTALIERSTMQTRKNHDHLAMNLKHEDRDSSQKNP